MKKINFEEYKIRASQLHKIMGGNIGLTDSQKSTLSEHLKRKNGFEAGLLNEKGKKYTALTERMEKEMNSLLEIQKNPGLPQSIKSYAEEVHSEIIYNRRSTFTSKQIMKGIIMEDEAITTYQKWLREIKGVNKLFTKNTKRLTNDFITGEADINPSIIYGKEIGVDTKCPWEAKTMPKTKAKLIDAYEWQNQGYMWLNDVKDWMTVSILVNVHEKGLYDEKARYYYAYGCPSSEDHPLYKKYIEDCKLEERKLIFDYDRFVVMNPWHDLETSREEWMDCIHPFTGKRGADIELKDRVIEKKSEFDTDKIEEAKTRIKLFRECLQNIE